MTDKTIGARARRQRELRKSEGWHQVTVWVPTEEDVNDIRDLAAERRARAEALYGLSKEVKAVNLDTELRIAKAISEHGSAAYTNSSGAVLELMTNLAEEDDLHAFSRAYVILARAKPTHAHFVAACVPAKISNFLIRHRGISAEALMKWAAENPEWAEELKVAVRDHSRFSETVEKIATAIKQKVDRS